MGVGGWWRGSEGLGGLLEQSNDLRRIISSSSGKHHHFLEGGKVGGRGEQHSGAWRGTPFPCRSSWFPFLGPSAQPLHLICVCDNRMMDPPLHAPHLKLEHAVPVLVVQHKQLLELLQLHMESMRADQRCGTGVKRGRHEIEVYVDRCGPVCEDQ